MQRNEVGDLTVELLSEVCNDAKVEPHLQPLDNEIFQKKTANVQGGHT